MAKSLVFVVVALVGLCRGLYFHIGETEQKCFMEEVPAETMIVGEELSTEAWRKKSLLLISYP